MNRLSRFLLSVCAAVPLLAAHVAVQAADRPSVESFFRHPDVDFVKLSPSGRYVVLLNRLDGGQQALVVRETADLKKVNTITTFESARLEAVRWVNDNRLTFTLKNVKIQFEGNYDQFAVDRDGKHLTHLISGNWTHEQQKLGSLIKDRVLTADYMFLGVTHDGSDDIIVGKLSWNNLDPQPQSVHPYRLNTRSRLLADMVQGPQPELAGEVVGQLGESVEGRTVVAARAQSAALRRDACPRHLSDHADPDSSVPTEQTHSECSRAPGPWGRSE